MIDVALPAPAAAAPILVVAGLLAAGAWRDRRRRDSAARQVRLIDALGAELGLIVAPRVRKPIGRPWRVEIRAPVGPPVTVGRIVAIAHETLTEDGAGRYELVLRPGSPSPGRDSGPPRGPTAIGAGRSRAGSRSRRGSAARARAAGRSPCRAAP